MLSFNINIPSDVLLRIKLNVRFQYKADIRVDCFERLLSSESGHSVKPLEQFASDPKADIRGGA